MGVEFILLQPTFILYALIFLFMILMFPILINVNQSDTSFFNVGGDTLFNVCIKIIYFIVVVRLILKILQPLVSLLPWAMTTQDPFLSN